MLVIILAVGIWYAWPRLPIITGYAAKNMCSGIFLSERTQEQIEQQELNFFPINLARNVVDMENRSVTSSLLGLVKRTAVYREGLGSVLVIGYEEEILKNQTLTYDAILPEYPDTVPWPLGDRIVDTVPAGLDREKLAEVVNSIFDRPGEDLKKTYSAIVVYKGQLVAEQYAEGVTEATRLVSWSMAKSVTNALVGIRVKEGGLVPDAPPGIPEWENDERSSITLDHLMRMNSGLEWDEDYFDLSHVTKLLYMEPDMYNPVPTGITLRDPPILFAACSEIVSATTRRTTIFPAGPCSIRPVCAVPYLRPILRVTLWALPIFMPPPATGPGLACCT